jgi:NAD(P)-dependent dehydrogenase (short-subunit alcohol dehydrogenase family)
MKTAIVTGGNRGLGFLMSQKLAKAGFHVVIAARSEKNGAEAVAKLTAAGLSAESMVLDVSSFASINSFVSTFGSRKVDVLVNNAGIMTGPGEAPHKTVDGHEATFATNVYGPALLTLSLLDALKPGRVINVSSRSIDGMTGMGGVAHVDFDDVEHEKEVSGVEVYKASKLALTWFTFELARRLKDKSLTVNAVCPGFVPETVGENAKGFGKFLFQHVLSHVPGAHSADEATDNMVSVIVDPLLSDVTGKFFGEKKLWTSKNPETLDATKAAKMWDLIVKKIGVDDAALAKLGLT